MPVFEQGYRAYTGPVRRGSRALAIAWESVRPRMRWWVWLLAAAFSFFPYVVFAVLVYIVTMSEAAQAGFARTPSKVAFEQFARVDPRTVLGFLNGDTTSFYWEILATSGMSGAYVFLPAIACAGILAADRRTGALQIYFARPVTPADYFAGKLLATAAFSSILTVVPTLGIWAEACLLGADPGYVLATWTAPFSIVLASAAYAAWAAGLVMALSSLISRPVVVGIAAVFAHLFLMGLGGSLSEVFDDKRWLALSPPFAIGGATAPFFGLDLPEWLPMPLCLVNAVGLPALGLGLVVRRLRAVEVVT